METRRERATWRFVVALTLIALALIAPVVGLQERFDRPFEISWIVLAIGFAAAERFSVNLETRREAHALTFSEIPLTLGLLFAVPGELLLARVIGAGIALVFVRRMPPIKVVFNLAVFAVEAATAVLVFYALVPAGDPVEPMGWLAAFAGVGAAHLVSWIAVSTVLALAGAPVTLRSAGGVLLVSGANVTAATAVALGAAAVLWNDGRSWILLIVIGAALGYFFVSFMRIRERHQALSALHQFTSSIDFETDTDGLVHAILGGVAKLLKGRKVVAILPTNDGVTRFAFEDGKLDRLDRQGLTVSEVAIASGWGGLRPEGDAAVPLDSGTSDAIASRLSMLAGEGVLLVDGRISDARRFDKEDVQLLETAAGHAATAFRNAHLVDRLREEAAFRAHQALHDDVTDLPNQRALLEQLEAQLALGTRLVMLTARIHSLREVNETLGRAMGDEMLRQVAARLRPIGRRSWCARSGTDEFTLVVPGGQDESDELADKLVEVFDQPVLCHDVALAVTVGVGVALAPQHGTEADLLLRRASLAASRSALDGTSVTTWASDRDPYDPQSLTIAADLRDAIPDGELDVHFQPQLDLATGQIVSAEALVRWNHPRLGDLRPDQFIPAAENTGAIDALTFHVLEVATATGARWHRKGWGIDIAVNLSARNLTSARFTNEVAAILDRTGFPAESLTLELTESSVMTEAERALATLYELHGLGIALSIDDFGTGYSSLAHLRRLPVGEIKVDKSFVFDLTTSESDEAIVRSMIDLGHNLGLSVVVEGVETVEVRNRLEELHSDRLQGYLLSRPLSAAGLESWLAERPVRALRADSAIGRVVNIDRRR